MDVKFLIAGDRAVSVEFGSVISLEVNAKVRALDEKLKESPIEGMVETVPTYCALIVHYRPEVIRYSKLVEELEKRIADMHEVSTTTKKVVKEIPVYYGGETGPDLEYCAELENTTTEEIIRKHSQHEYYVYMLGFAPGHPQPEWSKQKMERHVAILRQIRTGLNVYMVGYVLSFDYR